jgi:hypothetical protein
VGGKGATPIGEFERAFNDETDTLGLAHLAVTRTRQEPSNGVASFPPRLTLEIGDEGPEGPSRLSHSIRERGEVVHLLGK